LLRGLTKKDWLELLQLPENRVPSVLVLRGTRNLRTQYEAHRPHFQDVIEVGSPNGIFEDVFVGDLEGNAVGYASVYGAPMASEIVHLFGVLGTSMVVQTGVCGALAEDIEIGDLFIPTEAYRGEGASQYYEPRGETVAASVDIHQLPGVEAIDDVSVHSGRIYTTSALLAEGEKEIERWYDQGFSAVDMETSATFAVADHFGMDRVAILYVFDNPRRRESIVMTDSHKDGRRALGNRHVIDLALRIAAEYGTSPLGSRKPSDQGRSSGGKGWPPQRTSRGD